VPASSAASIEARNVGGGAFCRFIKWAAVSQGPDNTKAINVGPDGQRSNWLSALKRRYVGHYLGSLTVDGWVVIGILAIMSAVELDRDDQEGRGI